MSHSDVQDLSKESVGKLFSRLTPGQLWKVGGALIVLLTDHFILDIGCVPASIKMRFQVSPQN